MQAKHGQVANGQGDDGLARLKELLGNVKAKVEGIGDQGMGGRDFNKNIMPAEEGKIGDTIKAVGKKVLDKLGHGSDEDLIKDLQKKVGAPQHGKPSMAKPNESVELESILKLSGLAK